MIKKTQKQKKKTPVRSTFACETLFICVIIRSASQSLHLLCLQELIHCELKRQEKEEEEGERRGKNIISLRKVKIERRGRLD